MNIYLIENSVNLKMYVGITSKSVEARYRQHLKRVNAGENYKLYNAMRKYGVENFTYRLIDVASDWQDACKKERFYIAKYNSRDNGYNMTLGGEGQYGLVYTDEMRKARSILSKGEGNPNYGRVSSMRGKHYTEAQRLKYKESAKKRWLNKEYIEAQRLSHIGKKHTPEVRELLSKLRRERCLA